MIDREDWRKKKIEKDYLQSKRDEDLRPLPSRRNKSFGREERNTSELIEREAEGMMMNEDAARSRRKKE